MDDYPRTEVRVTPQQERPDRRTFAIEARGREIVLRFRPRFYQKHRGLRFFEPWTYEVWPKPVVGWCNWFAFLDRVTEEDVKRTADVIAEVLPPYAYEYLQIDDGYQRATGLPELWLEPNAKFPGGLAALAAYIRQPVSYLRRRPTAPPNGGTEVEAVMLPHASRGADWT